MCLSVKLRPSIIYMHASSDVITIFVNIFVNIVVNIVFKTVVIIIVNTVVHIFVDIVKTIRTLFMLFSSTGFFK